MALFQALGKDPNFRSVPLALMRAIVGVLTFAGTFSRRAADKAEFARTGLYYASESMLVWDEDQQRYDAESTPEFGKDQLTDHYSRLASGEEKLDLGAHSVF